MLLGVHSSYSPAQFHSCSTLGKYLEVNNWENFSHGLKIFWILEFQGPLEILAPAGGMLTSLANFLTSLKIVDRMTHPPTHKHASFLK